MKREVELAKKLLESKGYTISKKSLREAEKKPTRGYIHQDGEWHDYEELDFLKGYTMYKFVNGMRYSISKQGNEYKITIWDTSVEWPGGTSEETKNFDSMEDAMRYVDSITRESSSNPRKSPESDSGLSSSWESAGDWKPVDTSDYRVSGLKKNGYELYTQVVDIADADEEEKEYYGINPNATQAYNIICYDTPDHRYWIDDLCEPIYATEEEAKRAAERYINNH